MAIIDLSKFKIKKENGYEVIIKSPIKKTYQIETNDKSLAVGIAIDFAKGRYPFNDWKNIVFDVKQY